jgi:hypothetical protein
MQISTETPNQAGPRQLGRRRGARLIVALAVPALVADCTCVAPPYRAGSDVPLHCSDTLPLIQPVETDILFVIDDSLSMVQNEVAINRELPAFVSELQRGAGVGQSVRVGVIDTSVYAAFWDGYEVAVYPYPHGGWLHEIPTVDGGPPDGALWLTDPDADLVPRLAAAIQGVGVNGSYQETPFEAARIALTGSGFFQALPDAGNPNAGFLRPGAQVLVVVASDEDDCSEMSHFPPRVYETDVEGEDFCTNNEDLLTPVGDYLTAFQRLDDGTGRPRDVLWGAIAPVSITAKIAQGVAGILPDGGPVTQNVDCPTSGGPGFRHREMALAFDPTLEDLDSICAPDFHQALLDIAQQASAPQTVNLSDNVPDARMVQVKITRADGGTDSCTLANGGITIVNGTADQPPAVRFQGACLRRSSDLAVQLDLLCAG